MKKQPSQSNNCFSRNLIDLSFKADRESKGFTSRLIWENLALKVVTKLKILVDRGTNHAIKRRIAWKLRRQQAVSPNDLLMYRNQYWEKTGPRNYNKVIQAINQTANFNKNQLINADTNLFSRLLIKELFELQRQGKLEIIESTCLQDCTTAENEMYFFFDSYYFFNGGHVSLVEQTIDNLQFANSKAILVFLLDKRMILFPALTKAIINKYKNIIIIDSTDFPIKLPSDTNSNSNSNSKNEQLHINNEVNLDASILSRNSIFNPSISWKTYPYKSNY